MLEILQDEGRNIFQGKTHEIDWTSHKLCQTVDCVLFLNEISHDPVGEPVVDQLREALTDITQFFFGFDERNDYTIENIKVIDASRANLINVRSMEKENKMTHFAIDNIIKSLEIPENEQCVHNAGDSEISGPCIYEDALSDDKATGSMPWAQDISFHNSRRPYQTESAGRFSNQNTRI